VLGSPTYFPPQLPSLNAVETLVRRESTRSVLAVALLMEAGQRFQRSKSRNVWLSVRSGPNTKRSTAANLSPSPRRFGLHLVNAPHDGSRSEYPGRTCDSVEQLLL